MHGQSITYSDIQLEEGSTATKYEPYYVTPTTTVTQTQNHTLKAIWTANTYSVRFNANNGTGTMADQSMTYDTSANLPANSFTRTGYLFNGWNTAADGSGTGYTDGQSVSNLTATDNATVDLYAQWTPAVASTTVGGTTTYYRTVQGAIDAAPADGTSQNEGTLATVKLLYDGTREEAVEVAEGQNIVLDTNLVTLNSETATITNSGKLKITGSGTVQSTAGYNSNKYVVSNTGDLEIENATIYTANTSGIRNKDTGHLEINGGNINVGRFGIVNTSTLNLELRPAVLINDATISSGSNSIDNINGIFVINDATITKRGSTNTPAIVVENGKILIEDATVTANSTSAISLVGSSPIVEVRGGTFTGDYAASVTNGLAVLKAGTFSGSSYSLSLPINSNGTITLGDNSDSEIKTNSPVIVSNGIGVNHEAGTFNFYDGIIKAPTGNTINGTVSDTPKGYYVTNGTEGALETAYLENDYTVTFNYDGATSGNSTASKTVGYGENYGTLPEPTKTGYTFAGWNGKNLFNMEAWLNTCNSAFGGTITKGNNSVTITDESDDNTSAYTITYFVSRLGYGNPNSLKTPVKPNTQYKLSWKTDSNKVGTVYVFINNKDATDGAGYVKSGSSTGGKLTFTTTEDAEFITIRFDVNGYGNSLTYSDIQLEEGTTVTEYEPYFVTSTTPVTQTQNHTLKAIWTANTYSVRFNANNGTGTMADQSMTYGTSANLTANSFTRTGYSFAGWNTAADGSGTSYTDEQLVSNLTATDNAIVDLYAQWEETSQQQSSPNALQQSSLSLQMSNSRLQMNSVQNNINMIDDENSVDGNNANETEISNEINSNIEQQQEIELTNVAQIGDTEYGTISEAISNASNGDTIKLLEDIEQDEEITIPFGKNITINLNGKTLTSTSNNTINNQGTLTITGTGIIKNEVENGVVIYNTGILNIEGGVITTAENGGKAISNNRDGSNYQGSGTNNVGNSGTVNIKGGKIVTEGIGAIGLYNVNNSKADITGGIFETRNYASKTIYNDSELEMENAKVVVSDYDSIGIYNADNSKSCNIKETEILIEAEEIENYELIKNTDQFKEYFDELKPSYGVYNNSDSEFIIETATIKAERLKSVGIYNGSKGIITLGVDESAEGKEIQLNNASPIVYAISDNTTAIINSKDGEINFYDGRILTANTIKNIITKILTNYEIYEELNSNIINATLRLVVNEVESDSGDSNSVESESVNRNSEETGENEPSEEIENADTENENIENVDNESEDI